MDFEKLGLFYLGREYRLEANTTTDTPVLYDSRDLVTHAVCVGMTGSGKTGLCLGVIEEAAIDGVPVIAIDPKGDLGNLLLTFPELSQADFRPWIDEDEARRQGQSPDDFAAAQARTWREGLAQWGQQPDRISRLRAAADFAIYTPGSRAGLPVSVLSSFAAPAASLREDGEALAERAGNTATSLLALAGAESTARSREHTLVATILTTSWRAGRDLDLAALIQQVQSPPFQKIGILDLESFFPKKDRFDLALQLNGVLAAPGFEQWLEGEPMDVGAFLRTSSGRPRVSIFSIAHLGDAERMFFVSLLLNQILAWTRAQTGTSSLRAIVYMDEIAGYFPPVANPPSKGPLLTLLKQARAFGVGIVLATQNPVDLDYKGLANTGTWFLGRLQTERDKARVLDGLEGAAAGSIDRAEADRILSSLAKRVFLLHNVHDARPIVFQTRWTLSYLRGPLSRDQIRLLKATPMAAQGRTPGGPAAAQGRTLGGPAADQGRTPGGPAADQGRTRVGPTADPGRSPGGPPPVFPPGIEQYFIPTNDPAPSYAPVLLGAARVAFSDTKLKINESRDVVFAAPIRPGPIPIDWAAASPIELPASGLSHEPASPDATYAEVPAPALQPKHYAAWQKAFSQWLSQTQAVELKRHVATKLTSHADESERDFAGRVQDAVHEQRDADVDQIRKKFAAKREALAERIRKAEAAVTREEQQASQQKTQTMLSAGAAVIGALFGRKVASAGTLGRATTAARGMGRSMKEAGDVKQAQENVRALEQQLQALDETIAQETQALASRYEGALEFETITLMPKRGQVAVQFVALGWDPQ